MSPDRATVFAAINFEDLFQIAFVAIFFLGPTLAKVLRRRDAALASAPTPRQRMPAPAETREISWEDLLRGNVEPERQPAAPEHPAHTPEELAPREVLGELPPEAEFEIHGSDRGSLERPSLELAGREVAIAPLSALSGFEATRATAPPKATTPRVQVRPKRGFPAPGDTVGWRSAILTAEVLGRPLALRDEDAPWRR